MSVRFDPQKRIYDLYSFDVPYDLEPTMFSDFLRDYGEDLDSQKSSKPANTEGDEDELENLDLTFEEGEPDRHFPTSGLSLFPNTTILAASS